MPKVYLDKLVTSAHLPRVKGSTGYCSTSVFPDLSHAMITTQFCPPTSHAMTPLGVMTKTYRAESFLKVRSVERPASEMKRKVKFFRRAHNVFANKVLLDLESMKLTRNKRREEIWTRGKKDTGFEDLEDTMKDRSDIKNDKKSMDSFLLRDSSEKMKGQNDNNNQRDESQIEDKTNGDGFENFLYADDFNPIEIEKTSFTDGTDQYDAEFDGFEVNTPILSTRVPSSATSGLRLSATSGSGRSESSLGARPSTSTITAPGSAFSSSSTTIQNSKSLQEEVETKMQSAPKNRLNTTMSTISISSQSTRTRRKKKDSRRRKAFNQSTLFECLLDTLEIPNPNAPRFGMLSPSRTDRDRTIISTLASPIKRNTVEELTATTIVASMNEGKWDTHSVDRAMTGDKPCRPKRYS